MTKVQLLAAVANALAHIDFAHDSFVNQPHSTGAQQHPRTFYR
jgi:hypothetical protein